MAQRPRDLQPERSAAHLLGARLRTLRDSRGLSLSQLGELVFCSGALIGKIEKAQRRPQPDLIKRCDDLLGANGSLLSLMSMLDGDGHTVLRPHDVLDHMPMLRRLLDTHDSPDDGPIRPVGQLREDVQRLVQWRLDSDYAALAVHLQPLLPELQRHMNAVGSREAAGLLTQAYRAADAIADKFGLFDLSARIIDLMRGCAAATGDVHTIAAVEYVRAEVFFASGDWDTGQRMVARAASTVRIGVSPRGDAIYGSLLMRAAILAARGGDLATACEQMDEAMQVCRNVPEGVYCGTAFGPASVRIHRLSLALDSSDIGTALAVGRDWTPPRGVPGERLSHFFVDLARVWLHVGNYGEATEALAKAWHTAPQHFHHQTEVSDALAHLLAKTPYPSAVLLDMSRQSGLLPAFN